MSTPTSIPTTPRPAGADQLDALSLDGLVGALGRADIGRAAFWRLVSIGPAATPAVRAGLADPDPAVRRGGCEFLTLFWTDDVGPTVARLLSDPDAEVRWQAALALTTNRSASTSWADRRAS